MIDLNSPIAAQMLRRLIDEQVKMRLAELLPNVRYGTVDTVDATNRKCAVFLYGSATSSPGFTYPRHLEPAVGDPVRVVIAPGGDRYVDAQMTGNGIVASGAAFPAQPAYGNNRPFYRTDLRMEFFYDGTRWLTTQLFTMQMNGPDGGAPAWATTGTIIGRQPVLSSQRQMYLERLFIAARVSTTNNVTNYWRVRIMGQDGAATPVQITVADTSSATVDSWYQVSIGVAALLLTTYDVIWAQIDKTGAPGTLFGAALLTYRLVGT